MNKFSAIDTYYIRPDRTIDTLLLTGTRNHTKLLYVFNYQGIHYRVFPDILELSKFLNNNGDYNVLAEFDDENELDNFLRNS